MSEAARGQGRRPSPNQARAAADKAFANKIALCCYSTGRPYPPWFGHPELLPKRPPGRMEEP